MSRWAGSPALLYLGEPRVSVPRGFSNNNWVPTWLALTQILKLAGAAILIALAAATIPALAPLGPQERILFESRQIGECQTARLAISRRACLARLGQDVRIDTAENR